MTPRIKTRVVHIGSVAIGGDNPVAIQSMTNTATADVDATVAQVAALAKAGCAFVRVTVNNTEAAAAFKRIRAQSPVPLVADIHFDYKLAIAAIEAGADKIRINPGNIGSEDRVRKVVGAATQARVPIRIGVNSGSLEKALLDKYGHPCAEALADSAINAIGFMESLDFGNLVVSIKASNVPMTIDACRLLSARTDIPQHIGITEAGTVRCGTIRSAVGVGTLLAEGIGDTLRVSLAGDPVQEVFVAKEILKSLGLAKGPTVIACPTCGRTQIDVAELAEKVEAMVADLPDQITIAVMGCVVNGPGEAREADVGIAGGRGEGMILVKGEVVARGVPEDRLLEALREKIGEILAGR
jgi:(E)-4-hydroxy-3-methylbut-2-enyl-diphosphate synthase